MNETQPEPADPAMLPGDPALAAGDPEMFGPLTTQENTILRHHLTSGWYKQSAVYPVLSEPWKEISAVLDDLHGAWQASYTAEREAEAGA
jgi:hypothetical protein